MWNMFFNTNITDFILYILLQLYFKVQVPLKYPREYKIITIYSPVYNFITINIIFNSELIPTIIF
jgi:hypothetical protein